MVYWGAIDGSTRLFHVQSDSGAIVVGLGIAAVTILVAVLASRRGRAEPVPILYENPWCLPWAGVYAGLGAIGMMLGEPWSYAGFGLLFLAALYLVAGGVAVLRQLAPR